MNDHAINSVKFFIPYNIEKISIPQSRKSENKATQNYV
ncbi:hypothetical protein Asal01_01942 [Fodinibius salicampi]